MNRKKPIIILLSLVLGMILLVGIGKNTDFMSVEAATSSEIKEEIEKLEEESAQIEAEIEALRGQLSENLENLQAMMAQKGLVDQEIKLLNDQIAIVNEQITVCTRLIADKQEELEAAQTQLKALQEKNKARIRAMEENGELSYWSVLAEANSFAEMLDHLEIVAEIAKADEACMQELNEAAAQVQIAKDSLSAEQVGLQEKRLVLDEAEVILEEKRVQTDQLLLEIKAQEDEYETMIEDSEALQEDLMAEIAQKNEEYDDAKYQEYLASQRPATGGAATESAGYTWLMPCTYWSFTSPFGYRWHPISGQWKMHNGVDLAGAQGTPILATRSGVVTVAAYQEGGAGWYVAIKHDNVYSSIYMHMTHYIVSAGQYVEAGQVIGYMGTSGGSTGVHLHFGISKNGVYVNPAEYINIV